jgi:hypothetical protein
MKNVKNYSLLAALLGTALIASAATPQLRLGNHSGMPVKHGRTEMTKLSSQAKSKAASFSQKKVAGPSKIITAVGANAADLEKYGTLELLMSEDFSRLDNLGTEDNPDFRTKLALDTYEYPWWNFNPIYTELPNWGVGGAYPAGGTIYFHCEESEAHVNTPLIDCTKANGNIAVLEFKARAFNEGETYDYLYVEAAETNNMGSSWDILEDAVMFNQVPDQWTTFRIVYRGCGPTTLFNIVGIGQGYMLLDDVKVYQLVPNIDMPVVKPHTEYKGTSFVANWESVEGADHYLLNVYSSNSETQTNDYLIKDLVVSGDATSYEVTNAVSGEIYYYNVTAVDKDGNLSIPSFDQTVYDLETPVMNEPVIVDDYTHEASWSAVPGADVYNYTCYDKRVAEETGTFVVTDENFDDIVDMDGYPTGLTKEDPDTQTYDQYWSEELHQQGWCGYHSCPYDGYLCVDGWWYEIARETASFESPELDFSKDGGKFNLTVDLAGANASYYDEDNNEVWVTTNSCVALFNWNDELEDYEQVEMFDTRKMTPAMTTDFQTYEFNFTKGGERSKVAIFAVGGVDNLYVDNLRITQNYQKGEYLVDPFLYKHFLGHKDGDDPTIIEVTVPWYASGNDVLHQVSAYGRQVNKYQSAYEDRESLPTPITYVRTTERTNSVGHLSLDSSSVARVADHINIENPDGSSVRVLTLNGQTLYAGAEKSASVSLPGHGIYMVRIGHKTVKVIY